MREISSGDHPCYLTVYLVKTPLVGDVSKFNKEVKKQLEKDVPDFLKKRVAELEKQVKAIKR